MSHTLRFSHPVECVASGSGWIAWLIGAILIRVNNAANGNNFGLATQTLPRLVEEHSLESTQCLGDLGPMERGVFMRRVVITGLGVISPHGLTAADFWKGIIEGRSSTAPVAAFDPSGFPSQVAGTVPVFKTADYVPKSYRKATKIMARDIELAVVAADGAVRDAKLATRGVLESMGGKKTDDSWFVPNPPRLGCNIGAGLISADLNELAVAISKAQNPDGTFSFSRWGKSDDPSKT